MIDTLTNTYFYSLLILSYLIILIFTIKHLKLFEIINSLKITVLIKSRFISIRFFSIINEFIANRIILPLRSVLKSLHETILSPVVSKTSNLLKTFSFIIKDTEIKSSRIASNSFSEAFTFISLLLRKSVDGGTQIAFSVMLALIVVIYFILTMQ